LVNQRRDHYRVAKLPTLCERTYQLPRRRALQGRTAGGIQTLCIIVSL